MNNRMVPLVQVSRMKDQLMVQVMPGVDDPTKTLMQVAVACVQAAESQLETERKDKPPEPAILRPLPGMRVPRNN